MAEARVQLSVQTRPDLGSEPSGAVFWSAELTRATNLGTEVVATAQGCSFDCDANADMVEAFEEVSDEYGLMASAVEQSGLMAQGSANPLLINDLVVAPQWRGHNLGPHLLRWMAMSLPGINSVFLVPEPLPTRLDEAGTWVSDWDLPRAGSGARRKVRHAYRKGGFTHLRSGTWWTTVANHADEMAHLERVMAVLDGEAV